MYGMRKDEVRLLPHDPAWKDDFLHEKHRMAALLQDESVQIGPACAFEQKVTVLNSGITESLGMWDLQL